MRFVSYWQDSAPAFDGPREGAVEGQFDVAVIGGGFTGLAAARRLAKGGATVVVLEGGRVGSGASGRNGGHINNGLAHSYLAAKAEFGTDKAIALYRAFDDAVDTIERLVAEEAIDCAFRRCGKLKLASKPEHYDSLARNFAALNAEADPDTALLGAGDLAGEIGSSGFHGAMLSRKAAKMHMGRFVTGLAHATRRAGAVIFEDAAVIARTRDGGRHRLTTARGAVLADQVLIATGAYTSGPFAALRRRIIPVGSFLIATRPLTPAEVEATVPSDRTYVTSMNIGNYFRLSPDRRLIFGGRARFSARVDQRSDAKSGAVLQASLAHIFPHLADVGIDYCWGGLVDMTKDRYPRAGVLDGLHYAMGYSGHGTHMSVHMGEVMADILLGREDRNPFRGMAWPALPLYSGTPWFLPAIGLWYRLQDKIR